MKLIIFAIIKNLNLALVNEKNKIISIKTILLNKNLATILADEVSIFLNENKMSIKKIKNIYVINGPGSFTSIKLVCIFANVWAYKNKINLFEISTCDFFKDQQANLIWLKDGKNRVYCLDFKKNKKINNVCIEDFNNLIKNYNPNEIKEIIDSKENFIFNIKNNIEKFKLVKKCSFNYVKDPV